MTKPLFLLPLLVLGAGPAVAQANSSDPAATADPDKKVCRREQALGSFLTKRVCHTRAEWATIDRSSAATAESALSHRRPGMPRRD